MSAGGLDRRGLLVAAGAFILWGVAPLYWHALKEVPAMQIAAHRIVWSAVLVAGFLFLRSGLGWLGEIRRTPKALAALALSAVLIAFNWALFIWAVNSGHVVEASLGYYINPLLSVLLGVLVLRERLSRMQSLAVACAVAGVLWMTWQSGRLPWIGLSLAGSFALYGLVRKLVPVDSVAGFALESLYMLVPAAVWLAWAENGHGGGFFGGWGVRIDLMLVAGGLVTAVPLIGFAYGVRRIPLSVAGLMQYIAPTLSLLIGVLVFGEPFGHERAIGFVIIWTGLLMFALDGWRHLRAPR